MLDFSRIQDRFAFKFALQDGFKKRHFVFQVSRVQYVESGSSKGRDLEAALTMLMTLVLTRPGHEAFSDSEQPNWEESKICVIMIFTFSSEHSAVPSHGSCRKLGYL